MNGTLNAVLIVAALLLAAITGLWAALNRPVPGWQFAGAAVVEAVVIAVVGDAVVRIVGGYRPHELVTYIGYLIALLLTVPVGAFFALVERTRFGSLILAIAALLTPFLIVRLLQILRMT